MWLSYIYIYIERERERDTREPPGLPFIGLWLSWPLIGEGRWVSIRNQVQFILTYSTEGHSTNMLNLSKGRHYWPRILVCSCLMGWVTLGNHLIETNHFFFFLNMFSVSSGLNVRTYVIHLLGTYVTILCNWLIL